MNGGTIQGPIVGAVRDFHVSSFRENIYAVFIASQSSTQGLEPSHIYFQKLYIRAFIIN